MKIIETSLWLSGLLLIAIFFVDLYRSNLARRESVHEFMVAKEAAQDAALLSSSDFRTVAMLPHPPPRAASDIAPALFDWRLKDASGAVAVLRIARLDMEVPVHDGTDDAVLAKGAGLVEGTARPGGHGNVAIAAHRDSYFRGLRDVAYGDLIELESFQRKAIYRVSALAVVEPEDVHVLAENGESALTLVTCYPFQFVGNAPQRYIVRAVATDLPHPISRR